MNLNITFRESQSFALLSIIALMAYVAIPYWMLMKSVPVIIVCGILTLVSAVAWARLSAAEFSFDIGRNKLVGLALIMIAAFGLNWRALNASYSWKGDEEFHVSHVISVLNGVTVKGPWFMLIIFLSIPAALVVVWMLSRWKYGTRRLVEMSLVFGLILIVAHLLLRLTLEGIIRYQYLSKIVNTIPTLFVYPLYGIKPPEIIVRLVPAVCAGFLAWIFMDYLRDAGMFAKFLLAVLILTTPILLYYSSLLYLELPAILLMAIVCSNIEMLSSGSLEEIMARKEWYCLILIGFIKETTLPFLVIFVFMRTLVQLRQRKYSFNQIVINELKAAYCVLWPVLCYLYYRNHIGTIREYHPALSQLFDLDSVSFLVRSVITQLGPMLWLGIAGLVVLAAGRKYIQVLFLLLVVSAYLAIHLVDFSFFIGYSRFNLMMLPALLCAASVFLGSYKVLSRKSALVCLLMGLVWNYLESPVLADGSRMRRWGDSRSSVVEFSYPVKEACEWINKNAGGKQVCLTGHTYTYHFWSRYLQEPGLCYVYELVPGTSAKERFQTAVFFSALKKYDYILYMVMDDVIPDLKDRGAYTLQASFANKAGNVILILKKT